MQDILTKYAERPAPRYTSYPTVPHFAKGFPEETYRTWLSNLPSEEPVSLYLHLPYCKQMCWYCGCNMKLAARREPVAEYVRDLHSEIDLLADAIPSRLGVAHLHWGGGTPTVMTPDDLTGLMAHLRHRFDFNEDAELAIESDPRTLSDDMIACVGDLGFTRASFGVQEFDPVVQKAINRIQPPDMVARAVGRLRDAGVRKVNFDLIYGLPHQTSSALAKTVEICSELQPDRVALFGYAHVPWMAKNQRMIDTEALPGREERAEQLTIAGTALESAGYQAIGIDHFAKPDDDLAVAARNKTLRRNFQGYTSDTARTLLGIGATSIGQTPSGFVQNITETGAWSRAVRAGILPIARGHALSGTDRLRSHVIERIMCEGSVDLREAAERYDFPEDWYAAEQATLDELEEDEIITTNTGRVSLTETGMPLARIVASAFDAYLGKSQARHSRAL